MGTQQQLLLVVTIIIIAIAITVGINSFNHYSKINNRNAIIADLNTIAGHALGFYRAPKSMGGGEQHWIPLDDEGNVDKSRGDALGSWINLPGYSDSVDGDKFHTQNGVFWMNLESWSSDELIIIGSGLEKGDDSSYSSSGHGEAGCVEVELRVVGSTQSFQLTILN